MNNSDVNKNKGLEKLLYDGVHPDCVGSQHPSWKNSWVAVQELNPANEDIYSGLMYTYFVDKETGLLYCFDSWGDADEAFNPDKHVPVEVSCYMCHVVDELMPSW